ncbi:unnamed protein product, partial [Mesorhabditis belari]|uniref:Phospholipase A2-like central domain-containing protein n=1 Tax=Mesorhabditis belari TaxID=2138241 RepID=A0AAF3F776_9BILA
MTLFFQFLLATSVFLLLKANGVDLGCMNLCMNKIGWGNFDLLNYGCFCGPFRGQIGMEAQNDFDGCCKVHDDCYSRAQAGDCSNDNLYTTPYRWQCVNNKPSCDPDNDKCKMGLCKCDKGFVECLSNHLDQLHKNPGCPSQRKLKSFDLWETISKGLEEGACGLNQFIG